MKREAKHDPRLEGLDVARFLALVGMVIVNFNVVMVNIGDNAGPFAAIAESLQGRAAAVFVVLAGVGLGLNAMRHDWDQTLMTTLRRAAFLLVIGLLNQMIFDADIVHYYAFYFLFGVFFLRASSLFLAFSIAGLVAGFVVLVLLLDYDAGWRWETYSYRGFWTPEGFVRNLVFNGWHPLVPWFAFLLLGILLSRLNLRNRDIQLRLLAGGGLLLGSVTFASHELMHAVADIDAEAAILFTAQPVPPMPLYMLAGGGAACAIIGLCLLLESPLRSLGALQLFTTPGRQTLTLYVAHIVIGMGALEALGMIGGQEAQTSLIAAALFVVVASYVALFWSRYFARGAIEMLMRKVAG